MKRKFCLLTLLSLFFVTGAHAQYSIYDDDFDQNNPLNCDSLGAIDGTNFVDMGGNYLPNMDETITFCPDLAQGTKVSLAFATNIGYEWNVDGTDTLYVFDGPSITSPLLGMHNSVTDPNGFFEVASFANNPSGCLTVRFRSDAAVQGTGWIAKVACGDMPQPFFPHIEAFVNGQGPNALNPIDTGYVNICFGDSVLFVAKPDFPYSFENTGAGYSQTADNASYNWTIGGVGTIPVNNDSIWFHPPARSGYFIDLRITDIFPQSARMTCKVRVSQLPIFAGTGPLEDTVCLGINTELIGGVTPSDTVGVEIPGGTFNVGGNYAGLTALPDGSGAVYETTINMTGMGPGSITSASDLVSICLDIEHSYIGDIEIALTCPNGTMVSLVNAYNAGGGELVPGGCGNAFGIFLGNDTDFDGGAPGSPVWTYCFSEVNATTGSICDGMVGGTNQVTNVNGFTAMDPSFTYQPDGNFSDFIGCPLEGDWTITVQDNQGIDDGYIFQWGIVFDASLYPNPETYQNYIVTENWTADPTIISGQSDTSIIVLPVVAGPHNYTYNVVDDFGCAYDTTVVLYALPQPEIFPDTMACFYNFNVQGTQAYDGGVWTASDTAVHFTDPNALNPSIWTYTPGTYTVTFTDNACGTSVSADIYYPAYVYTEMADTVICQNMIYTINTLQLPQNQNYLWSTGETTPTISIQSPGVYGLTVSNECHTYTTDVTIGSKLCDILAPNIIMPGTSLGNEAFFVQYEGLKTFKCTILNRWGNKIFEYDNPAEKWDGTFDGKRVEDGVYFYYIDAELESGEALSKQGFFHVVNK
jgi:subtilisin-like proprotein convertase family protein